MNHVIDPNKTRLAAMLLTWALLRRSLILIAVGIACLALLPNTFGINPAPDGGYPNSNTAEGDLALDSLSTGTR